MDQELNTIVKYNQTSCYYCNEWFNNGDFEGHVSICKRVLEKCPKSCEVYIERGRVNEHLKVCPKIYNNGYTGSPELSDIEMLTKKIERLEADSLALRSVLNEELLQRNRLITDIGNIRKRNNISDEWTHKVGDVLTALKKCLNQETSSRCIDIEQCRYDIENLLIQYQTMEKWRMEILLKIDNLDNVSVKTVTPENGSENINEEEKNGFNAEFDTLIKNIQSEIEAIRYNLSEQSIATDQSIGTLNNVVQAMNIRITDNLITLDRDVRHLKEFMNSYNNQVQEIAVRQAKINYELKGMQHIVTETEDKTDKLDKKVEQLKKQMNSLTNEFTSIQTHVVFKERMEGIHNLRGHLLWRIRDYPVKLIDAKENNTTLSSPIFYNKQFGYALRLDVKLNGMGTWKNRNLIASLSIIQGEYDPLLQWPCKLQADVILRDLHGDNHIYKTIYTKRSNSEYQSNQFIHIPHKSITQDYIKDNSIFIEVRVHK